MVDFRKRNTRLAPIIISSDFIERVDGLKLLGTIIYSDLVWGKNRDAVVKKGQERPFFLRELKKLGLRRENLIKFYHSAIGSILAFSMCVWPGSISLHQRSRLDSVVKRASTIFGSQLTSLKAIYIDRSK